MLFNDMPLKAVYMLDGVKDIVPLTARANFTRALREEAAAGHTTDKALELLNKAIEDVEKVSA